MDSSRKCSVLVVDDFDDTRELFAEVLMHEGYHSIMARSGNEALARMQYVQPDVVVSDLDMADMGGAELINHLRGDARFRAIPIIIVTGADKEKVAAALGEDSAQVHAVLHKPVTVSSLLAAVADALAAARRKPPP